MSGLDNFVPRSTAYLMFQVSTKTGRLLGVGIFSSADLTRRGSGELWFAPSMGGLATYSAPTYQEAVDGMRETLGQSLLWWGKPGEPLHDAIAQLAAEGQDVVLEWGEP